MLKKCGTNTNFPAFVIFIHEVQFTGDGIQIFHNQHVWAYEKPHALLPSICGPVFVVIIYSNSMYFQTGL
jgi:hypothetical protein